MQKTRGWQVECEETSNTTRPGENADTRIYPDPDSFAGLNATERLAESNSDDSNTLALKRSETLRAGSCVCD